MVEFLPPSKALERFVKQFVIIYSIESIDNLTFLPNGGNFIVFNRGVFGCSKSIDSANSFEVPQGNSISIKLNKVKQMIVDKKRSSKALFPIILVELEAVGYYNIFNKDASGLADRYVLVEETINDTYFSDIYKHDTIQDEIDYLNKMLLKLYKSQPSKRLCIKDMIHKIIHEDQYETLIKELLNECDCSRSTLERRFKKVVGVTPKKFIFIMKFCKTLTDYVENGYSFNDLPYIYSDQSHMYAVFKKFLGLAPRELVNNVNNNTIKIYQLKNYYENENFLLDK